MEQHLACAAAETPLVPDLDEPYFGTTLHKAMDTLLLEGALGQSYIPVVDFLDLAPFLTNARSTADSSLLQACWVGTLWLRLRLDMLCTTLGELTTRPANSACEQSILTVTRSSTRPRAAT